MDNDAQTTFYVTSAQIMDIIGDEEWMKGEMNCICNIASNRKVTLTWGAKKKSSNRSQLSIGDNVIVSNHGTKWEHRAKILKMNVDGISVLVKWDTSLKRENIFLNDCRRYDVEETSMVRKRKATDFFAPMVAEEIVHESEPDVVEYNKGSKPQYDLILGNETMKELGIVLDFKNKTIIIDEITLPMRNINLLQGYLFATIKSDVAYSQVNFNSAQKSSSKNFIRFFENKIH